ncbi:DegV family protein [Aciditerrimonas ferrireducens]|jgi:fatty acid-binding protein DegV|uniref:DegV family protein n=1 Tax=Aciditerrimonas ferrireducens TaxID=667306 RepID=UPI0020048AEB|nr:DegV family protein [Aciditerrimonas ferrireducens]MCK4176669.1 DegV family protein [Aciditerrimonas ferrireducens]
MTVVVVDAAVDPPPELERAGAIRPVRSELTIDGQSCPVSATAGWQALLAGRSVVTAPPSALVLADAYNKSPVPAAGVHVSSKLSATYAMARQVVDAQKAAVLVVDSGSMAAGAGLVVLGVLEELRRGEVAEAARVPDRVRTYVLVAQPRWLEQSGHASLLPAGGPSRHPLVGLVHGRAFVLGESRSWEQGVRQLTRQAARLLDQPGSRWACSLAPGPRGEETEAATILRAMIGSGPVFVARLNPVVGAHLGPASVVLAVLGPR